MKDAWTQIVFCESVFGEQMQWGVGVLCLLYVI